MERPDRSQYEEKYKLAYRAGIPFVSTKGYDQTYKGFLVEQRKQGSSRLIEFGCGEGFSAALAADLKYTVLAIDIAPSAIAKAIETFGAKYNNIEFRVDDVVDPVSEIPSHFDIAANIGCLQVIEAEADALKHVENAFRSLKPKGFGYFQNMVTPDEALRWYPEQAETVERWRVRINSPTTTKHEEYEVNGKLIELELPSRLGNRHRDLEHQIRLLTQAGFHIRSSSVKTPGVNSPFEAVIVATKPG